LEDNALWAERDNDESRILDADEILDPDGLTQKLDLEAIRDILIRAS